MLNHIQKWLGQSEDDWPLFGLFVQRNRKVRRRSLGRILLDVPEVLMVLLWKEKD